MCFEETKTKLLNIWINVIWFVVECWHRDSSLTCEDIIKDFFQRETVALFQLQKRCNDGAKESPRYEEGTLSMKWQGLVQQKNSRFFSGQRVVWSLRGHITDLRLLHATATVRCYQVHVFSRELHEFFSRTIPLLILHKLQRWALEDVKWPSSSDLLSAVRIRLLRREDESTTTKKHFWAASKKGRKLNSQKKTL